MRFLVIVKVRSSKINKNDSKIIEISFLTVSFFMTKFFFEMLKNLLSYRLTLKIWKYFCEFQHSWCCILHRTWKQEKNYIKMTRNKMESFQGKLGAWVLYNHNIIRYYTINANDNADFGTQDYNCKCGRLQYSKLMVPPFNNFCLTITHSFSIDINEYITGGLFNRWTIDSIMITTVFWHCHTLLNILID